MALVLGSDDYSWLVDGVPCAPHGTHMLDACNSHVCRMYAELVRTCPFHLLLKHHCPMPSPAASPSPPHSPQPPTPITAPTSSHAHSPVFNSPHQQANPNHNPSQNPSRGRLPASQLMFLEASQAAVLGGELPEELVADQLEVDAEEGVGVVGPDRHTAIRGLLAASCSHAAVGAFVWSVVRHVVPPALLGDKTNRR